LKAIKVIKKTTIFLSQLPVSTNLKIGNTLFARAQKFETTEKACNKLRVWKLSKREKAFEKLVKL
jgi:hypothetical protein